MTELFTQNQHRILAGGGGPVGPANLASPIERFLALILIVAVAALGGFIVKIISKGHKFGNMCEIKALLPKKF